MGARYNRLSEAVLTCTHDLLFQQKCKNGKTNQMKIVIFRVVKNRCILHGRDFVMFSTQCAYKSFVGYFLL